MRCCEVGLAHIATLLGPQPEHQCVILRHPSRVGEILQDRIGFEDRERRKLVGDVFFTAGKW